MVKRNDTIAGRYVVKDMVGRGGMGRIYRVFDKTLEEEVALKTLLPQYVEDKMVRDRFFNEARIARKLSHPNIVRVHDIGSSDGMVYISMEMLKGRSLRQLLEGLKPGQRVPINAVLRMFDALCAALDYAHQYTIHRDIKPENVMILPDGSVKLMDFGISKLKSNPSMTSASMVMGTPHYMPPEQLKNSAKVDARADVYSVGVMLYEVITGNTPTGLAKPASDMQQEVPPALDPIIEKCVQPDPKKRYQSAAELRDALREIRVAIENGTNGALGQEVQRPAAVPHPPYTERLHSLAPIGIALLLVILGAAGFGWKKAEERRERMLAQPPVVALSGTVAVTNPAQEFKELAAAVKRMRKDATTAIVQYAQVDREGVLQEVLDLGKKLWAEAGILETSNPVKAVSAGWNALHCYAAVLIWPDGMVFVPPGAVRYEDVNGRSIVTNVRAFFIDEREVTMEEFAGFCARVDWPMPGSYAEPDTLMTQVAYYDALAYVSSMPMPRVLPTEAQWVRAIEAAGANSRLVKTWETPPDDEVIANEPASSLEGEAAETSKRVSSFLYAYGEELYEWTRTPAGEDAGRFVEETPFRSPIVIRGGTFRGAESTFFSGVYSIDYETRRADVTFRGIIELPRSIEDLERLIP